MLKLIAPEARTTLTRSRMLLAAIGCIALLSSCKDTAQPPPSTEAPVPAPLPAPTLQPALAHVAPEAPVKMPALLDQGWSDETRDRFWFTAQGSQILPYKWFLALEQPGKEEPFRSAANIERLRYIPMPASAQNHDGLPLGFTKDVDASTSKEYLGLTCAACHTSKLVLGGHEVIVDGAPTLADFKTFLHELNTTLAETKAQPAKFDRFAARVLGDGASAAQKQALRDELGAAAQPLASREHTDHTEVPYGYGRLDAFGGILNNVSVNDLKMPQNGASPDAPVSYPHIWDAPRADRVQWNGAAFNAPVVGGLIRNIGEVLGVFGRLDFKADSSKGYDNSVNLRNLGLIENWLKELNSPSWPSDLLPAIDQSLASKGKTLYAGQCRSCHSELATRDPGRTFKAVMVPVAKVQTDPTMASNYLNRRAQTGILEGSKIMIVSGNKFGSSARSFEVVINGVSGIILRNPLVALQVGLEDLKHTKELAKQSPGHLVIPESGAEVAALVVQLRSHLDTYIQQSQLFDAKTDSYKARPLNGIWATAPYLHNGSVPNLSELLKAPAERVKQFAVGSREFDPVNVGLRSDIAAGTTTLDTTLKGNLNTGHDYGTKLAADDKRALIEYVKTL
jgi:mono/diheme cytochrome c family protein